MGLRLAFDSSSIRDRLSRSYSSSGIMSGAMILKVAPAYQIVRGGSEWCYTVCPSDFHRQYNRAGGLTNTNLLVLQSFQRARFI